MKIVNINYLLILLNIDSKNISCLIDRKKLSYHKSQLDMKTIQITNISIECDSILYKGTIFDGKLIQNNSETIFLIQDCFYYMNNNMLSIDMIIKLQEINSIINTYINKESIKLLNGLKILNSNNKIILKINTLHNYDNLENIINNLSNSKLPTNGLIFYPPISGINILYIDKKIDKVVNNIINCDSYDLINNYINFLLSRTYSYELNIEKSKVLWLSKTIIPDVYDISENENSEKISIALIPNLKISYMCDNLINDKPIPFNCIYSLKFKKWIPILIYEK